jgi:branched-chain amino acid transport system ATP-binding protein
MDQLLIVEDACKLFGSLRAVDNVSFAVEPGEIFGIAGPNGSGKSTLFNIITSIPFPADAGRITFNGRAIQRMRANEICRAGVARTFQKETAFDTLSTFDNVMLGSVYGLGKAGEASTDQAVRDALAFVGIGDEQFHRPAGELSVFDKKRLMLASALATRPSVLLLDEPASGLTQPEIDQTIELVRRVNAEGVTVLLIEHVLPLLLSVSNRLMVLNQGQELVTGDPDAVMRDERVVEAYLGSSRAHG